MFFQAKRKMFYLRNKINNSSETHGDLLNSCCYPESFHIWKFSFEIFSKKLGRGKHNIICNICSVASLVIVFPYSENFDLVDLLEFKKFIKKIFLLFLFASFLYFHFKFGQNVIMRKLIHSSASCRRYWDRKRANIWEGVGWL